ncbi:flagellin, partial [Pseudoduganella sp. RAF53_2]
ELDRVANTTQFNGQNVLDGSLTSAQFQVGANSGQTINIGVQSARATDIGNNTMKSGFDSTAAKFVSDAYATESNGVITDETLTFTSGNGVSTTVDVKGTNIITDGANTAHTLGDSAKKIAANVNAKSGTSGVTATATTEANLSDLADGSYQFELRGDNSLEADPNSKAVTISAKVKSGDLSALAQAINAQSGTTGISASIKSGASGKEIQLTNSSGSDIQIKNTNADATDKLATANIRGADQPASGNSPAMAAAKIAVGAVNTFATIGGKLDFSSDSGFTLSSSVGAGKIVGAATGSDLQSVAKIDVSTVDGANAALKTIDSALNSINSNRASLGAIQNRFASTISNLQTTSENLSASRSRIQDTDFASETANMTRGQILQQAGTAMLAQANSLPNGVLSLLRG